VYENVLLCVLVVGYGSWFDHVQEFWEHRMDSNVLFLKYEDMYKVLTHTHTHTHTHSLTRTHAHTLLDLFVRSQSAFIMRLRFS